VRRATLAAWVAVIASALALAACGSGSSGQSDSTSKKEAEAGKGPARGSPPQRETIADAQRRIAGALATGNCHQINALAPVVTAAASATPDHCQSLKNLANLVVGGAASYGGLGGVIDYRTTDGVVSAVLVRDLDGLFHVAFLNPYNVDPSVGTALARPFDSAARRAVDALRANDCQAFLSVAYRRFGEGGLPEPAACQAFEANGLGPILRKNRRARPVPLGGNDSYAFYGLNTSIGFFTIIEARESDSVPPSLAKVAIPLPAGSPAYGWVQAYLTKPAG
jgi:hypothetical protein